MSQEQMKGVFKHLNELLFLTEKDWENELPIEQYYAIILAYNDQYKGRKREKNEQGLAGKVYGLTLDEKIVFEQAYKSGKSAVFDEQDIFKSLISICDKDVGEILSKYTTRHEIIENLHNLAVQKVTSNKNAKSYPFAVYEKASNCLSVVTSSVSTDNFRINKSMLETLNTMSGNEEANANIDRARNLAIEGIYSYIYEAVKVPVYADAYQKIMSEAELT